MEEEEEERRRRGWAQVQEVETMEIRFVRGLETQEELEELLQRAAVERWSLQGVEAREC